MEMMRLSKLTISPAFNAFYYSFYLKGVLDHFKNSLICYSSFPFPKFSTKCLAFIAEGEGKKKKIVIDSTDSAEIRPIEAEWCDIYGKVNCSFSEIPSHFKKKVIPIGPSFGVRVWNPFSSWLQALNTFFKAGSSIENKKEHFANYRRQYKYRLNETEYKPILNITSKADYIFHLSSLWVNDEETNCNRALFINICKELKNCTFEGGFAPFLPGHEVKGFEDRMIKRRYLIKEWIEKTRCSCLVFNTPAVYRCHGWKLAEYLALGKAIISTPLTRELPSPLIHGHHLHFVKPQYDDIKKAVSFIVENTDYRLKLEKNAYHYYKEHLSPGRVIERMLR